METKRFKLGVLLSVTTGRLLTSTDEPNDNGIGQMYDLLGWMTSDAPFTHQLGRFSGECKPWLLRWFPELAEADKHVTEETGSTSLEQMILGLRDHKTELNRAIEGWLELCVTKWGMNREYDVPKIPADDHERKDAYDELVQMRGTDEGIIIVGKSE